MTHCGSKHLKLLSQEMQNKLQEHVKTQFIPTAKNNDYLATSGSMPSSNNMG